jgi:hypothetical protein
MEREDIFCLNPILSMEIWGSSQILGSLKKFRLKLSSPYRHEPSSCSGLEFSCEWLRFHGGGPGSIGQSLSAVSRATQRDLEQSLFRFLLRLLSAFFRSRSLDLFFSSIIGGKAFRKNRITEGLCL